MDKSFLEQKAKEFGELSQKITKTIHDSGILDDDAATAAIATAALLDSGLRHFALSSIIKGLSEHETRKYMIDIMENVLRNYDHLRDEADKELKRVGFRKR